MIRHIRRVLRRTFVYSERAGRAEFWWWMLLLEFAHLLVFALGTVMDFITVRHVLIGDLLWGYLFTGAIVGLIGFLPTLAVAVRRLHDTGRRGWWVLFWCMTPIPGWFVLLIITIATLGGGLTGGGTRPSRPSS